MTTSNAGCYHCGGETDLGQYVVDNHLRRVLCLRCAVRISDRARGPLRRPLALPFRVTWFFRWFDLWVGAYVDTKNRTVYVCPIPMCGVRIEFR